jgi:hypothetical protein
MLTGWVPFRASSFAEVLGQHAREQPLDPRQAAPSRKIPDSIAELTMQLLAKDPNERPSTGAELAEHIDALVRADRAVLQVLTGPRVRSNADEATVSVSAVRGAPTSIGKLPAGNETVVLAGQPSKQAERGRERKWVWWIGASAGIGVALALWVFAAPRPDLPRAAQEPAAVPGQPTREVPIRGLEHPTEPPFEPPVPTNARVPPDLGATSNVAEVRGNAKTEQDAESPPPKPDPSRPRRAPATRRRSPAAQQKAAPTGGLPGPALQFKDEVYDD